MAPAFFNIEVELKLIFVSVVSGLISLLSLHKKWPVYLKKVPAYAIGSIAAFWMTQRIVAFWA
jgi:hypothetical protein